MSPPRRRIVLAHHLIFTAYGHWLPNDPRGSGSKTVRNEQLAPLGEIHIGRKRIQPHRSDLRAFQAQSAPLLAQKRLWLSDDLRHIAATALATTANLHGYTVWACAILANHVHLVVARHRHSHVVIWRNFSARMELAIKEAQRLPESDRLWANRPYSKFLYSPQDIRRTILYVQANPAKEGLPVQLWDFVRKYEAGGRVG